MPDVYLFISQNDLTSTVRLRDSCRRTCEERDWNFQSRVLKPTKTPAGRPILPITISDAKGLYPRSHRAQVATLVFGTDPAVPLRPDLAEAVRFGHTVPLRRYLDYKSCWVRVPNDPENLTWAGIFESWCASVECEDERDPRCLPFHVFKGDGVDLRFVERRQAFNDRYGPGALRRDDSSLEWVLDPRAFHGREVLTIAGCCCRPGFHWDVASTRPWRLATPAGVWEGKGHVNVSPDAHIRPKGNNVRKVS
jgi:hypothetical protein